MPNENAPICGCGIALETPKSRNGSAPGSTALSTRNLTILIPKASSKNRGDGRGSKRQQHQDNHVRHQGPKTRAPDTGSTSSVAEQMNGHSHHTSNNGNQQEKRLNASRRTRSAERSDSHYTYIDSGSSIMGGGLRENTIPEALYATINETSPSSLPSVNDETLSISNQTNTSNRGSQLVYAVPSMTSPPPTYDVAVAKTCQSGLPPTYDEYLRFKLAMLSRSRTPPPPWSDSSCPRIQPNRLEHITSQLELREYLAQVALDQTSYNSLVQHQQQQQSVPRDSANLSNHQQQARLSQQALRLQSAAVRQQRARAMPPRSQSESRAHQQRIATMYEDAAFCMETTAITSAFEHGVAFCSLM
ncbi:uncharacterized protein [Venturia canescens]|nr:uncharacterized protein LOC122416312 isoform X2 [Venturia canescens]XP_043285053.1 uncharacterized protein LOC122416312 isoform X2 [Venturia canescens]XP_043285054.1 uncharacterized protein LOC122416312 isoform X2 [Venturia canescens]XP_043285055.1 uncharacterized protein LOC122416312 isoform X2 [Venturia canescens]XP_043285056.1 uncharacterized protein LOC122416312 isoform X2 [Venturia canescens]